MSDQQLQSRAPYAISEPRLTVSGQMVTTAFEIPGFRVKQNLGVVRGIVVRSRNVFVNIGAVFNQLVGGNIGYGFDLSIRPPDCEIGGDFCSESEMQAAIICGVEA